MSQIRVIENDNIRVSVSDQGAELIGVYDKIAQQEIIWNANEKIWGRHAPVLFPWVGRANKGQYLYENNQYEMTAHGFARDMQFEFVGIKEDKIVHRLVSNPSIKEIYPFDFVLEIGHTLQGRQLKVEWHLSNHQEKDMYFSIGAHPGFNVPILPGTKQSDYYLKFDQVNSLDYILIDENTGAAVPDQVYQLALKEGVCEITEDMWDKDAFIFEHNQVNTASILYPDGSPYVTVQATGFPYMGVWSKPGAPFICLEPWYGRTDDQGFDGDISLKSGIQKLGFKEIFEVDYTIVIHGKE